MVKNEEDLGKALKNGDRTIEIEGDLAKKVVKIKATGDVAWGVCIAATAVCVIAVVTTVSSGGAAGPAALAAVTATAGPAVAIWGVSVTVSAVLIAVAGGGVTVLNKLKSYDMKKISDKKVILKRKSK